MPDTILHPKSYELGYQNGARNCRDNILATIIGFQNDVGFDSEKYEILQELLVHIEENHGSMLKPYKG